MTTKIVLLALMLTMVQALTAQETLIQGTSPNLYVTHAVAPKETWYSIGRIYSLPPKDIAAYNRLSLSKPLEISQQVKVPLTANNFSQAETAPAQRLVPVYHVVQPKEWLYRISVNYNKVPVEVLQKWNGVGKDGAKPGTKLIVGYLKRTNANTTPVSGDAEPSPPAAEQKQTASTASSGPVAKASSSDEPKKQEAVSDSKTAPSDAHAASAINQGSYFTGQFSDNGHTTSGVTGIFKSTSGWKDGKYYALVSNVPVGTIIKVTYPSTSKSIYAKVLGELPDMKESAGLMLRISDAAAYELGSPESKFSVDVKY